MCVYVGVCVWVGVCVCVRAYVRAYVRVCVYRFYLTTSHSKDDMTS